ncbi:hypothetical protein BT69DRAFT_1284812 [Atractiella rhizophila]|nr:hypothetical protein BT69DRAFT_1284812 [Atractiella rhizophila]
MMATRYFHEKLTEKRSQILTLYGTIEKGFNGRMCLFQTFIIYLLLSLALPESPTQMALSLAYHGCAVMMMRELKVIEVIKTLKEAEKEYIKSVSDIEGVELSSKWKRWIKSETYKRDVFLIWLADIECNRRTNLSAVMIPLPELDIDLPSPDPVWTAASAEEWMPLFLQRRNKAVSFLGILKFLISDSMIVNCPEESGPRALRIQDLPDLGAFAEMVLTRTLGYLQSLLEQTMNEFTPVPTVLEKIGLEGNDRNGMLKQIRRATERVSEWRERV